MTNPYQQQHGPLAFPGGDSLASSGMPPLSSTRRPSYASVVSGGPPASSSSRPARSSGFSHLLNPTPDTEHQQPHQTSQQQSPLRNITGFLGAYGSDSVFQTSSSSSAAATATAGSSSSGANTNNNTSEWSSRPPRTGFPHFSRAFDLYMNKEPLFPSGSFSGGPEEVRFSLANPMPNITNTGFLAPSYLRGTIYLQKLEEQHRAKLQAEREGRLAAKGQTSSVSSSTPSRLASNGSGLNLAGGYGSKSASGTSSNTSGAPSLHRGGHVYDPVERQTSGSNTNSNGGSSSSSGYSNNNSAADDDEDIAPLPSRWNKDDKDAALEVLGDGYEVRHTGRQMSEHEASAIRADHYVSPSLGVYYFEVTVLNKKKEKTPIAIGLATKEVNLGRAPGWEPGSWGYHGDDGRTFHAQNDGKPYDKPYGSGDVVGCLVNFRLGQILFTRNGQELPVAHHFDLKNIKGKLYPVVGMKKKDDHILANFGQMPFQFDIDGYMKKQRNMIQDAIRKVDATRLAPVFKTETELADQMVLQYLLHDGYMETAQALAEELRAEREALQHNCGAQASSSAAASHINVQPDEGATNRQRIREAVLDGDIDLAFKLCETYYPDVLKENKDVYFHLRCRKFIEMIRKEAELRLALEEGPAAGRRGVGRVSSSCQQADDKDEEMLDEDDDTAAAAAHGNEDQDEEMSGITEASGISASEGVGVATASSTAASRAAAGTSGAGASTVDMEGLSKLSQDVLTYGMELQNEFPEWDEDKHRQLDEIMALIAYPNPLRVKEVAHMLDVSARTQVAEALNRAIMASLGRNSRSALENLWCQTTILLDEMRKDGGDGAFISIRKLIDEIPGCEHQPSHNQGFSFGFGLFGLQGGAEPSGAGTGAEDGNGTRNGEGAQEGQRRGRGVTVEDAVEMSE